MLQECRTEGYCKLCKTIVRKGAESKLQETQWLQKCGVPGTQPAPKPIGQMNRERAWSVHGESSARKLDTYKENRKKTHGYEA